MKLLMLPLLCLLLLTGVRAQKDVDVEGLRGILLSLLDSGHPVTSESLAAVTQSFSGVEKDIMTRYTQQLEGAKEAEELLLHDKILDLEVFRNLLFNLKALGVTPTPALAEALLSVIDDPSLAVFQPIVADWKKAKSVSLTDALKNSIAAAINAMKQVISGTSGTIRDRLKAKIATLTNGMAKSMLVGMEVDLDKIAKMQGGTFIFSEDEAVPMSLAARTVSSNQVNKVLNREIVQFLSSSMLTMTKGQVKQQVEILLRKVYDNRELPAILEAVLATLN